MSALLPTYGQRAIEIKQADGSYVTDTTGKRYLDFVMGIAVCNTGHRHPAVLEKIEAQLGNVWHTSNLYAISGQERVAEKLVAGTHLTRAFFCNSGTEANEAAFKLIRKWTGKKKIVSFTKSFHGRTFAMLGATGQDKVKAGFGPMVPDFVHAPFNDSAALDFIDDETAAVWLEVVQGEGGVVVGDVAWFAALQAKCLCFWNHAPINVSRFNGLLHLVYGQRLMERTVNTNAGHVGDHLEVIGFKGASDRDGTIVPITVERTVFS